MLYRPRITNSLDGASPEDAILAGERTENGLCEVATMVRRSTPMRMTAKSKASMVETAAELAKAPPLLFIGGMFTLFADFSTVHAHNNIGTRRARGGENCWFAPHRVGVWFYGCSARPHWDDRKGGPSNANIANVARKP